MVSGEKRNCEDETALERITTILLDIEGTTTSISFVKDILFPYVRDNLKEYVNEHWEDEEFKKDLEALKSQAKKDEEEKIENFCPIEEGDKEKESLIKNVFWQMDLDRKTTALKQLQGHIWREGYENGKLKGHVYEEVPQSLKKWSEEGRKLYIYSSGSVEAQKLLFKNSESGDLSGFISGYFDTEVGPKTEATSYTDIVKAVQCEPGQVLFLTDVVKEAVAADKAGLQVMIVVREGNTPLSDDEKKAFTTLSNFKDIVFETASKKKKICEEDNVKATSEKTENVEKVEDTTEVKNGEAEKMEVDVPEEKPEDCKEDNDEEDKNTKKTEVNDRSKIKSQGTIKINNSESNNVKVEDSKPEEIKPLEETEKDTVEITEEIEKQSADSATGDVEVIEDSNDAKKEIVEENTESNNEAEKISEKEEKENGENGMNGSENGEAKEENEEKTKEESNGDANGKIEEEEEIEALPLKKVPADEQADSTVEVMA